MPTFTLKIHNSNAPCHIFQRMTQFIYQCSKSKCLFNFSFIHMVLEGMGKYFLPALLTKMFLPSSSNVHWLTAVLTVYYNGSSEKQEEGDIKMTSKLSNISVENFFLYCGLVHVTFRDANTDLWLSFLFHLRYLILNIAETEDNWNYYNFGGAWYCIKPWNLKQAYMKWNCKILPLH